MDKQEEISFIEKQIKSLEDSIEFKEFILKEDKYKLHLLQKDLEEKKWAMKQKKTYKNL